MKAKSLPNYLELKTIFDEAAILINPAEVHGIICGILCGNITNQNVAWENLIHSEEAPRPPILKQLYESSKQLLSEFSFEFQLILPDDSIALPQRAEGLTLWCQGFLTGLKFLKIPVTDRDPSETTDSINDLIEIAKMNYEEVVASEEDEEAFMELSEYVRMAVIYIYQEIHDHAKNSQAFH